MTRPPRHLVLAALAMLAGRPALAQTKTGTSMGQFLLIEPAARTAAMAARRVAIDGP